jgi:hypothetical protein
MARRTTPRLRPERPAKPPRIEWPGTVRRSSGAPASARFAHLRIELDVEHEGYGAEPLALLHEREVVDAEDLLQMVGQVLRALSALGFRRVDHWEAQPGGWLPLPEATHARLVEPVAHLVRALSDPSWAAVGGARAFAARLSGPDDLRLDFVVRRVHRERTHAISIDLWGSIPPRKVDAVVLGLHSQIPLARAEVVALEASLPRRGMLSRPR